MIEDMWLAWASWIRLLLSYKCDIQHKFVWSYLLVVSRQTYRLLGLRTLARDTPFQPTHCGMYVALLQLLYAQL